jgi:hypothetical protein
MPPQLFEHPLAVDAVLTRVMQDMNLQTPSRNSRTIGSRTARIVSRNP